MIGCNINIPHYGTAKLLIETLESVRQQYLDAERVEVTVLDDCSPEGAPALKSDLTIQSYKVMRNPVNLGMVANWNRCLEYGTRECVHVLHCDDLLDPNFYSVVLPLFEDERIGLVHTAYRPIYSRVTSSHYWKALLRKKFLQRTVEVFAPGDEAVRHVMKGVICSSAVLRREAIRDVGGFRQDLFYSSDEEYWARLARRWAVAYVSLPLVTYRYHSSNYQLETWQAEDFWEKFQETRRARLAHLTTPTETDLHQVNLGLARNAVGISHKVFAAGYAELARRYLNLAIDACPGIVEEKSFLRANGWISQGSLGRVKAWLRSSH